MEMEIMFAHVVGALKMMMPRRAIGILFKLPTMLYVVGVLLLRNQMLL